MFVTKNFSQQNEQVALRGNAILRSSLLKFFRSIIRYTHSVLARSHKVRVQSDGEST